MVGLNVPDEPAFTASMSPQERTTLASKARYPDLHRAGGMLRQYARGLRNLGVAGLIFAVVAFVFSAVSENKGETQLAVSAGLSLIEWAIVAFVASVLFAAVGEASIALADIAVNSEKTADALRKVANE